MGVLNSLGLKALVPISIVAFAVAELGGWPLAIAAGIIVGLLARDWLRALASSGLGVVVGWGLYFLAYWGTAPIVFARVLSLVPVFLAMTFLLGLVLGLLSSSIGYFAASIVRLKMGKQGKP